MKQQALFSSVIPLCFVGLFSTAEVSAISAQVDTTALNIRTRPSKSGAVITSLAKGAVVSLLGDAHKSGWAKIEIPTDAPLWVSRTYVRNGKVVASQLNVRSGPGAYHESLGQIAAGTEVKIVSRFKNWYMIHAPRGLTAYVSSYHIKKNYTGTPSTRIENIPSGPEVRNTPSKPILESPEVSIPQQVVKEVQESLKPTLTKPMVVPVLPTNKPSEKPMVPAPVAETTKPNSGAVTNPETEEGTTPATPAKKDRWGWLKRLFGQ